MSEKEHPGRWLLRHDWQDPGVHESMASAAEYMRNLEQQLAEAKEREQHALILAWHHTQDGDELGVAANAFLKATGYKEPDSWKKEEK